MERRQVKKITRIASNSESIEFYEDDEDNNRKKEEIVDGEFVQLPHGKSHNSKLKLLRAYLLFLILFLFVVYIMLSVTRAIVPKL